MMLVALVIVAYQTQPALSEDKNIIGLWNLTQNATDVSGKPCPFVPESFVFYKDRTLTMGNLGNQRMHYKTTVTPDEKQVIEKRVPALKGKNILLIKPNPNMGWTDTPMVYAYSIKNDKLTLVLQGYSPAKFARIKK